MPNPVVEPYPQPNFVVEPYPEKAKAGTGSDYLDADKASSATLIANMYSGEDLATEYNKNFDINLARVRTTAKATMDSYMASEAHQKNVESNKQLQRLAAEYFAANRPALGVYVLQQINASDNLNQLSPDMAVAQSEGMAVQPGMGYENPFANNRYKDGLIAQRIHTLGWLDKGMSLAKSLIPLVDTYKRGATMRPAFIKEYAKLTGQRFNTLTEVANHFHSLPPSQQMGMFKTLEQLAWDTSNGDFSTYSDVAYALADKSMVKWLSINTALDVSSIIPFAKAPSVLAKISKTRLLYRTAAEVGNFEKAGTMLVNQLSEHVATLTGEAGVANRLQARISADPVMRVVDGVAAETPGLAASAQKVIAKRDQLIAADINLNRERLTEIVQNATPNVTRGVLLDDELRRWSDKLTGEFIDVAKVEKVGEDSYDFTFVTRNPAFADYTNAQNALRKTSDQIDGLVKQSETAMNDLINARAYGDASMAKALEQELEVVSSSLRKLQAQKEAQLARVEEITKGGIPAEEITDVKRMHATIDSVGHVELQSLDNHTGTFGRWVASRQHNLDKIIKGAVHEYSLRTMRANKVDQQFKQLMTDMRKDLAVFWRKGRMDRVNKWLLAGDERKVVFGIEDMRHGTGDLPRLSDAEIAAYYKFRDVADSMWWMNNTIRRDSLIFSGYKELELTQDGERLNRVFINVSPENVHFSPKSTGVWDSATQTRKPVTEFYHPERGWISADDKMLRDGLRNKELALVETHAPFVSGGKRGKWVVVETKGKDGLEFGGRVKDISPVVLEKRTGYVPKVYDNLHYLVTKSVNETVSGAKIISQKNIVGFETQREAEKWLERHVTADKRNEFSIQSTAMLHRQSASMSDALDEGLFLGAFGQFREEGAIKFGPDMTEASRMSAWEAFDMYSEYLARHADSQAYKQAMIRRFENTVKHLENQYGNRFQVLTDRSWTSPINDKLKAEPWYNDLVEYQDTMKGWFAVPTKAEQAFESFASGVGRAIERAIVGDGSGIYNKAVKKAAHVFHSAAEKEVVTELKKLTFNYAFGLNPVQYLVQSAGMLIPFALHPVQGVKIMPHFMALRAAWGASNSRVARYAFEAMTGKAMKPQEWRMLDAMYDGFKRSGIGDSVMVHADYGSNVMRRERHMSSRAWRDAWQQGMWFYRSGELNTRTYAWVMAYDNLVESGALRKGAKLTDAEIDMVTKEGLRLSINMTPANAAKWQHHPILSIPTQFFQITAKFYENLLKGVVGMQGAEWTRAESAKAIALHLALFGTAGAPLSGKFQELVNQNLSTMMTSTGVGGLGLDPERDKPTIEALNNIFYATVNGGMSEVVLNEIFTGGESPDLFAFSERLAVASGVKQSFDNFVQPWLDWKAWNEEPSVLKYLGASGMQIKNRTAAAGELARFFSIVVDPREVTMEEWGAAAGNVAKFVSSSGNNTYTALTWLGLNQVTDSLGRNTGLVPEGKKVDPAVVFGKAVGLSTNALIQQSRLRMDLNRMKKVEQDAAKTIAARMTQAIGSDEFVDAQSMRNLSIEIAGLLSAWDGYPLKKQEILDNAFGQWQNPKIPREEMFKELLRQRLQYESADLPEISDQHMYPTLEKRD